MTLIFKDLISATACYKLNNMTLLNRSRQRKSYLNLIWFLTHFLFQTEKKKKKKTQPYNCCKFLFYYHQAGNENLPTKLEDWS